MDRDPPPTRNLLLDALPPADREALLASAVRQPIGVGTVLLAPGDEITTVPFPVEGTLSLVAEPDQDHRVEAASIGREGLGSVHAALGSRTASQRLFGQVPGEMITVDVETFARLAGQPGRLQRLVYGYIEATFTQAALSAACNALHHVNQRCARWLLMSHDRVDGDTFELRQEFLAYMLGVQRPTVTIAAGNLAGAGLITYHRGVITIVDRERLEEACCPCYGLIQEEYTRLVPIDGA